MTVSSAWAPPSADSPTTARAGAAASANATNVKAMQAFNAGSSTRQGVFSRTPLR
jgi:hypothetical protein